MIAQVAPVALDFPNEEGTPHRTLSERQKAWNRTKSKVRSRIEHPFLSVWETTTALPSIHRHSDGNPGNRIAKMN